MKKHKTYWLPPGEGATVAELVAACESADSDHWTKAALDHLAAMHFRGPGYKTNVALYPGELLPYDLMRIAYCE